MGYRPDIDGLRAVAVLSVLLFHVGFARFAGGFVGVDVFFVISGFLITGIIREGAVAGTFSFRAFYVRRMRRLFPALLATVVLTLVAAVVFFAPDLLRSVGESGVAAVLSVSNIYFWLDSGYFEIGNALKPLLHTWSLSVEEQFYLVWPMVLVFAAARGRAFAALVVMFVLSLVGGLLAGWDPSAVFYLMPFRVYELALGGMMVWVIARGAPRPVLREVGLLLGLALIAIAVVAFTESTPFPINGLVPCLGAALVILCGTAPRTGIILRNRVAVWIGLISYSIYLVHWPIVVFYRYVVADELTTAERVALIVAAIVAGYAMHRLVETRFRQRRRTASPAARGPEPHDGGGEPVLVGPGAARPSPGASGTRARRQVGFVPGAIAVAVVVIALALSAAATGWEWRLGDRTVATLATGARYGGDACGDNDDVVRRCEVGSGRPVVVMGDSHALQYYAGLARHLPDRRLIFVEGDACFFFSVDKTRIFDDPAEDASCRASRQAAFDAIRSTGADVILAQSWGKLPMTDESGDARYEFRSDAEWAQFAATELERLKADLGIENLLVMGNVPTTGDIVSPGDCLSRPVRLSASSCEVTPVTNRAVAARQAFNQVLGEAVGGFASFEDPFDYLCDAASCRMVDDGGLLYSNRTHLSELGSELVVGAMVARADGSGSFLDH